MPVKLGIMERFKGSKTELLLQPSGKTVISYSYTSNPAKLLWWDTLSFMRYAKYIPSIVYPAMGGLSGPMDELAPTLMNIFCLVVHGILFPIQLAFILGVVPALYILPGWISIPGIAAFFLSNKVICDVLLNHKPFKAGATFVSNPNYAPPLAEHEREKWVFLNGVSIGHHWMQGCLDRLALTFKRPVHGIHNTTSGIAFDLIECIIQRCFGYATRDIRMCYSVVKENLYNPQYDKVVFILHSQGGIEGGMVIDWLLQELPRDLMSKLEVYTFGNAANHFNNPFQHRTSEKKTQPAATDAPVVDGPVNGNTNGTEIDFPSALANEVHADAPNEVSDLTIGHIEHYAHTTDFVARWGVVNFFDSNLASPQVPRFMGRLFKRTTPRGGHLLVQHYLNEMFPLQPDASVPGGFSRCLKAGKGDGRNNFMASEVALDDLHDDCGAIRDAHASRVVEAQLLGHPLSESEAMHLPKALMAANLPGGSNDQSVSSYGTTTLRGNHHRHDSVHYDKVENLSRLWQYRDGKVPH